MISIQNSVTELEKAECARDLALECYLGAVQGAAQYAVELEEKLTGSYRKHLAAAAAEIAGGTEAVLRASRGTVQALFRDYHDRAARYLNGLREELSGTARALEDILVSLCESDGDYENRLREAAGRLRSASGTPEGAPLRAVLLAASESIEHSLEEMRKSHQLTTAQFQVEIRGLHKRIDDLESAAAIDKLTRLFTGREVEARVGAPPPAGFRLLAIRVNGLRPPAVAAEVAGTLVKRLHSALPDETPVGRWNADGFVAFLDTNRPEAIARGRRLAEQLSGAYACLQDGKTVHTVIQLGVAVVDTSGEPGARVLSRVKEFLGPAA
jgi:GGDEF domain-containing protein